MKLDKLSMVEHIKKYNPVCPVCDTAEWVLDDTFADIIYHNTGVSQATLRVVCTCANCGNTLFFDPYKADAVIE